MKLCNVICVVIATVLSGCVATSLAGILKNRSDHSNNTSHFLPDESLEKTRLRRSFSVSPDGTNLWPNGIVYYYLNVSSSWKQTHKNTFKAAIQEFSSKTCIRFKEISTTSSHTDYVRIFEGEGCQAHLGRIGGVQEMSLDKGCTAKGNILHEMMHTLGFRHEHQRPDRDQYLNVYLHNVRPGEEDHFRIRNGSVLSKHFDYDSVTMYGGKTFSKDGDSITISRKDGGKLDGSHLTQKLSHHDVNGINKLYRCKAIQDYEVPKCMEHSEPCQEQTDCCGILICNQGTCTSLKTALRDIFRLWFHELQN